MTQNSGNAISPFQEIANEFDTGTNSAIEVLAIDNTIIGLIEGFLRKLDSDKLVKPAGQRLLGNGLMQLKTIRSHGSVRPMFRIMANQILVVMVSYFESAFSDLFDSAFTMALTKGRLNEQKAREKLRTFTIEDLASIRTSKEGELASLIVQRLDIKFSNTKSIVSNFQEFFPIAGKLVEDSILSDTICAIECRHALVHKGGIPDEHLISNLEKAQPRNLKKLIDPKSPLEFSESELSFARKAMSSFLRSYSDELERVLLP